MVDYFKKYHTRFSLAAILLLFILVKLPAIELPYFWDELGVYASSGLYLHDNGIGLLPKNLPPELSRGHPLLFACIHGIGFTLFGDGQVGGHITSLIIAVVLLWSVYYITAFHYSAYTGLLAVMLLIVQPLFFAQSVLILPEICLGLFMIWALHFWVAQRFWAYAIMATGAILIKETAVIIPTVIIAAELFNYWFHRAKQVQKPTRAGIVLLFVPYLIFICFLMIQKVQNGWYLFPLHEDHISLNGVKMLAFAEMFFSFLLLEQGRIVLFGIVLVLLLLFRFGKLYHYSRFTIFLWMLILGGTLFCSLNFFMNRYALFIFIPVVILIAVLITTTAKRYAFSLLSIPIIFAACLYTMYGKQIYMADRPRMEIQDRFTYDENMSYTNFLAAQQQSINFVMDRVNAGDSVFGNFPSHLAMSDPRFGFTDKQSGIDFQLKKNVHPDTVIDYVIVSNPGSINNDLPINGSMQPVFSITSPIVVFTVYSPETGN